MIFRMTNECGNEEDVHTRLKITEISNAVALFCNGNFHDVIGLWKKASIGYRFRTTNGRGNEMDCSDWFENTEIPNERSPVLQRKFP